MCVAGMEESRGVATDRIFAEEFAEVSVYDRPARRSWRRMLWLTVIVWVLFFPRMVLGKLNVPLVQKVLAMLLRQYSHNIKSQ